MPRPKGSWILHHVGECPACGRDKSWDEVVTDRPKPEDDTERWDQLDNYACYDHCIG